jgi:hypothetical protein
MSEPDLEAVAREIRRNYDRCTQAILARDPDGFAAAFGPTARGETAEGVPVSLKDMYDFIAWRMGRTVTMHSFVVEFDTIEGSADEVWIGFTEDSSATVLDATGQPVLRDAHSVNRALWAKEGGEWSQVAGSEVDVVRTVDGVTVMPNDDPVGVLAYRAARSPNRDV